MLTKFILAEFWAHLYLGNFPQQRDACFLQRVRDEHAITQRKRHLLFSFAPDQADGGGQRFQLAPRIGAGQKLQTAVGVDM